MESPAPPARKSLVELAAGRAREAMGAPAFDVAWLEGVAMSLEQAVSLAETWVRG